MEEKNKKTGENCDFKKSQSSKLFLVFGYACAKAASYLARLYIKAATCWTTCIPPILLNRGYIYFSGPYIPSFVSFKNCSRRHLSGKFVFSTLFQSRRFLLLFILCDSEISQQVRNLVQITTIKFYLAISLFQFKNNF